MNNWILLYTKDKELLQRTVPNGNYAVNNGMNWTLYAEESTVHIFPPKVIWSSENKSGIGIFINGLVYPNNTTLDAICAKPLEYLQSLIDRRVDDFESIPLDFHDGVFHGLLFNTAKQEIIAFNSYLNHAPLYYYSSHEIVVLSSSISLITETFRDQISFDTSGIDEYVRYGINLSNNTIIKNLRCLQKASILRIKHGILSEKVYSPFPQQENSWTKERAGERLHELWEYNMSQYANTARGLGLGVTGGVDSRLIIAAWNKSIPLLPFTGSNTLDSDYLVAHRLCKILGYNNHTVEDYTVLNKEAVQNSFIEYLCNVDNPLTTSTFVLQEQIEWRKSKGIDIQLYGNGGETIGGEHYYLSRSSMKGIVRMMLPFKETPFTNNFERTKHLIVMGLRGRSIQNTDHHLLSYVKTPESDEQLESSINKIVLPFLNDTKTEEMFLERFRALYKYSNLLYYNFLSCRSHYELVSPFFSKLMMDFALTLPITVRNDRKLVLAVLKKYYPAASQVILTGSIFSPNAPHSLYKFTKPVIKGLNAKKMKIPYLQWYLQPHTDPINIAYDEKIALFMNNVISTSDLIKKSSTSTDEFTRWRLFTLVLAEKRFMLSMQQYREFLTSIWQSK